MSRRRIVVAAVVVTILAGAAAAVTAFRTPPDLGRVRWSRDEAAARREAQQAGRPLIRLTRGATSRPGTAALAAQALAHPIVVDAAAAEFVAVAVDPDEKSDPSVHFLDADGRDLVPAYAGDPSAARLLAGMRDALRAAGRPVSAYLDLVAAEYNPPPTRQTATFAVTCYWKGESSLGRLDGVLATRTGTVAGPEAGTKDEIVEVDFDPALIDYSKLTRQAAGQACFRRAYAHTPEQADAARAVVGVDEEKVARRTAEAADTSNQQQFYLSLHPAYHFLPLTALQATKVNAALVKGEPPERFLSPGQVALHRRLEAILAKDKAAFYGLDERMPPDRSPGGLAGYAERVERWAGKEE